MKLSISILACPFLELKEIISKLDPNLIDLIHLDIMDGNFVPQISFGESLSQEIKNLTKIPLDVHLMVQNPQKHINQYYSLKPVYITFHREVENFPCRLAKEIRKKGIKVGIALNPATNIETIQHILDCIDLILVMSVEPGFYGQKFIQNSFEKITLLKKMIKTYPIELQVDGGVGDSNFEQLSQQGVDIAVIGSYLFSSKKPNEKAQFLKNLIR